MDSEVLLKAPGREVKIVVSLYCMTITVKWLFDRHSLAQGVAWSSVSPNRPVVVFGSIDETVHPKQEPKGDPSLLRLALSKIPLRVKRRI